MTIFELWLVGLGGRTFGLGLNTASLVIIARSLEPVGRGQYFVFVALVLVLTAIADLGISQSAVVFGGRPEVGMRRAHAVVLALAPAIAAAVVVVGVLALQVGADLLIGMPEQWLFVAAALLPLSVYGNFWAALMIGARRLVAVNGMRLAISALTLGGNAIFVAGTGSAAAAVAVYVGVLVVQAAAMFVTTARTAVPGSEAAAGRATIARDMIVFGLRAYPGMVGALLWARSAVFVLNVYHGPGAVGIYSVAQQLAEKTLVPVQALQDLIYARMARLARAEATAELNRFLRLAVAAMVPTIALALVLSPVIVAILFSGSPEGSSIALRLLLVGSAVQSIPLILAPYFLVQLRRPGLLSLLGWSNAILNAALLVTLVPVSAETGAAAAMLVTQVCGTLLVLVLYLRIAKTSFASALILRRHDVALARDQALSRIRR